MSCSKYKIPFSVDLGITHLVGELHYNEIPTHEESIDLLDGVKEILVFIQLGETDKLHLRIVDIKPNLRLVKDE